MEQKNWRIALIIPAWNEEESLPLVLQHLDRELLSYCIVVDNNSSDATAECAEAQGALVLREERQGYGWACLRAMAYLQEQEQQPDIVVFLDGDFSDDPSDLPKLLEPLFEGRARFVVGARNAGLEEPGSLLPQQRFGNFLATRLMRLFFGLRSQDLGPFRAIFWSDLLALDMQDKSYGWTIEMQIKAAKHKIPYLEVPVHYRLRHAGKSKVSGTIKGSVLAGIKILYSLWRYRKG